MAGRGTGLPDIGSGGAVTPLTDFSGSAGIGERAAAESLSRVAALSDQVFATYVMPQLTEKAKRQAEQMAAAGEFERRTAITPVGEAFNEAMRLGWRTRGAETAERVLDDLRNQHLYDPDGFASAAQEARRLFIESSPADMAIDFGRMWDRQETQHLGVIRRARAAHDIEEAEQSATARVSELNRRLTLADPGTPAYEEALAERAAIQDAREANPAIIYSADQRARDDEIAVAQARAAYVGRQAVAAAQSAGGGYMGQAAAFRYLDDEILNGEALAHLPAAERRELWEQGRAAVMAATRADLEARRAREAAEQEARERQREARDELRLSIELGEIGRAEIMANTELSDGDRAGLLSALESRETRRRREAREDNVAAYTTLAASAWAGVLDQGEIAENLSAGIITAGQAGTLRSIISQRTRPLVQDVMAPVRDTMSRPGMRVRGDRNQSLALAEADAAAWVQANPDATLAERLEAGRAIAERHFGQAPSGPPPSDQQVAQSQAGRLAALDEERRRRRGTGNQMGDQEYRRRRQEIMGRD